MTTITELTDEQIGDIYKTELAVEDPGSSFVVQFARAIITADRVKSAALAQPVLTVVTRREFHEYGNAKEDTVGYLAQSYRWTTLPEAEGTIKLYAFPQAQPVTAPEQLKTGECWPERIMKQWDAMRDLIATGDKTSLPRDWFESLAEMRLIEAPATALEPVYQYYYRNEKCTADGSAAPDCMCWHDQGTGNAPKDTPKSDTKTWRIKPAQPERKPCEMCHGQRYLTGATGQISQQCPECMGSGIEAQPAIAPAQQDQAFVCSLGCTTECLARQHGVPSECPSLPKQPATAPDKADRKMPEQAQPDARDAATILEGKAGTKRVPSEIEGWNDIATAPKDGTMLRLLVNFTANATEDHQICATIGANNFDNDGEDVWQFAGWNWTHDCFTQGEGTAILWMPMISVYAASQAQPERSKALVLPERISRTYAEMTGLLSKKAPAQPEQPVRKHTEDDVSRIVAALNDPHISYGGFIEFVRYILGVPAPEPLEIRENCK